MPCYFTYFVLLVGTHGDFQIVTHNYYILNIEKCTKLFLNFKLLKDFLFVAMVFKKNSEIKFNLDIYILSVKIINLLKY